MDRESDITKKPLSEFFKGINGTIIGALIVGLIIGVFFGVSAMSAKYMYDYESIMEVVEYLLRERLYSVLSGLVLVTGVFWFIRLINKNVFNEIQRRCDKNH